MHVPRIIQRNNVFLHQISQILKPRLSHLDYITPVTTVTGARTRYAASGPTTFTSTTIVRRDRKYNNHPRNGCNAYRALMGLQELLHWLGRAAAVGAALSAPGFLVLATCRRHLAETARDHTR